LIFADFHVHTTFSVDSVTKPRDLVQQLVAHPFVKVAAVTDHGTVGGIEAVRRLAEPFPDILIISGVEITTNKGDIVILGTEELPPKPWTIESVVDFARETACVSVAVHPFREWGLGEMAGKIGVDAIEILNGASSASANRLAHDLAREFGLPGLAGSDAHNPLDLFAVCTTVQASLESEEVLKAIKKGLVVPSIEGKSIRF